MRFCTALPLHCLVQMCKSLKSPPHRRRPTQMPGRVFDLVYEASELLLNWCPAIDDPPFKKRNERRLLRSNPQLFAEVRSITYA